MRYDGTKTRSGFNTRAIGCSLALAAAILSACSTGPRKLEAAHAKPVAPEAKVAAERQAEKSGVGVHLNLQTTILPNGLKVVLIEDPTVPIVSYQTWYNVGSADEHLGITGISHFFEHLMFKGTPRYPAKEFFRQLEAKGAEVNAFTTRDYTVYYENFIPSYLEKAIDMESDRMQNLKLDDEVLNSERMVVLEERRLRTDNTPEGRMQEALWQLAYRYNSYQWPVIGYPQDVLSLTLQDLQSWYKSHYQPKNATIVVVGAIKADQTLALIRKHYGSIPGVGVPVPEIFAEPEQNEERRLVLYDDESSERFAEAYHVTSAADEDSYALDVLSNILFTGTTSRGWRAMVEDHEIALGVSSENYTPAHPGLFIISGTMKSGVKTDKAEVALDELIRKVQDQGVTAEEIRIAVRQLTVQLIDSVRTPYGMGTLVGTANAVLGDPSLYASDLAKYLKVTPEDVKRVAQKYLQPNNRSVVIMMPKKVAMSR
ncbi:MAG: pitrilysin family protein [Oligoflexia bacterium]|nr:pitrilysin family protein [Oligoflexia bacterium]